MVLVVTDYDRIQLVINLVFIFDIYFEYIVQHMLDDVLGSGDNLVTIQRIHILPHNGVIVVLEWSHIRICSHSACDNALFWDKI